MKYVIVGTGVAGIAALEAIRSVDRSGQITLIGDDPHGFYSRPGLAYYLSGEIPEKALFPKKLNEFQKPGIQLVHGHIQRILREPRLLEMEGRRYLPYDRLLLATGASAIPLDVPGSDLAGVLKLDRLTDAQAIVQTAQRGQTAVVVGGGITALELAEGLLARGMKVHYLLRGDRYWSNVLDPIESRIVERRLQEEGVKLHFHSEILEIVGNGRHVHHVRLKGDTQIRCHMLAYAIGICPQTYLARQSDLDVDRGILVNEQMMTNDPMIFAAGDVAQVYDPFTKRSVIDSLWSPAREQGTIAGLNMAGYRRAYIRNIAFNVTRLAGLTTTIIGMVGHGPDDDLVGIARGDSETWRELPDTMVAQSGFDVNHLRLMVGDRTLLGAVVMGDQTLSAPLEKMISNRMNITGIRRALLSPNADLSDIVAGFWVKSVQRGLPIRQLETPTVPAPRTRGLAG